jgi:PPOX class probable F420-dependent enzyme
VTPAHTVPDARARLGQARVGRLATVGPESPHLVPCCFAVDGSVAYSAVDDKPKRTQQLQRLVDVSAHPFATLLVDHYDEDWSALWWIRVSGPARVVTSGPEHRRAVRLLRQKYPQYAIHALTGPVLALELQEWRSWAAGPFRQGTVQFSDK